MGKDNVLKKVLIVIVVAGLVAFGLKLYVNHRTAQGVDQVIEALSPYVTIKYESVSSTMSGALAINGLTIYLPEYKDPVQIDALGIKVPSILDLLRLDDIGPREIAKGNYPKRIELFLDGIVIDTGDDFMMRMFRELEQAAVAENGGSIPTREEDPVGHCVNRFGYTTQDLLDLDMTTLLTSFSYRLEELEDEVELGFEVSIDDIYEFGGDVRFQGGLRDFASGRLSRTLMTGFALRGTDISYGDRTYERCAALGVDRATAKKALLNQTLRSFEEMGFVPDERLLEPLRASAEAEHKHFRVIGDPPQPVDLSRMNLYSPTDMPALLGVDLETW